MILNGNQRSGAKALALHLLKDENEHVEVHELRGFVSRNLIGALNEVHAISKGTKCRRYLYSLSLNPPSEAQVSIAEFERAIDQVEERLGLTGQPRAVVFHEKEQRRHCHVVWSRIDIQTMKAIPLSHDHYKLKALSRELFLEHGWTMPRGLADSQERNLRNFTLAEWQQARRIGKDPRQIKTAIQDAWAISDSKASFAQALQERGYVLARGDQRGFVAVDVHGEVYAVARQLGLKTKAVRERLGEEADLPGVEEARHRIAADMLPVMQQFQAELQTREAQRRQDAAKELRTLVEKQRAERRAFQQKQSKRQQQEALARQARFRAGIWGVWDRLSGKHKRIQAENEQEAVLARQRDREEKDQLIAQQMSQRRFAREETKAIKQQFWEEQRQLEREQQYFEALRQPDLRTLRDTFMQVSQPGSRQKADAKQERQAVRDRSHSR